MTLWNYHKSSSCADRSLQSFFFFPPVVATISVNLSFASFKRDDQQAVPNAKTEKEFTKQTSSKQVFRSGRVDPTEESGRKGKVFYSFLKRITLRSKSIGIERAKPHKSGKVGRYGWKMDLVYLVSPADFEGKMYHFLFLQKIHYCRHLCRVTVIFLISFDSLGSQRTQGRVCKYPDFGFSDV